MTRQLSCLLHCFADTTCDYAPQVLLQLLTSAGTGMSRVDHINIAQKLTACYSLLSAVAFSAVTSDANAQDISTNPAVLCEGFLAGQQLQPPLLSLPAI